MKYMKMNKNIFILCLLGIFLIACQSDKTYKVRGCGFSISLPVSKKIIQKNGDIDALDYDIYNEKKVHLFAMEALNAPSTLNYFDLYEKNLTKDFKLLGSFVDEYNEMGLGNNMVTVIYGANMNIFPQYIRVIYSPDTISDAEVSKILSTLSIEKDSASSEYCR